MKRRILYRVSLRGSTHGVLTLTQLQSLLRYAQRKEFSLENSFRNIFYNTKKAITRFVYGLPLSFVINVSRFPRSLLAMIREASSK